VTFYYISSCNKLLLHSLRLVDMGPDYSGGVSLTLFLFEWIRTFDREVEYYWTVLSFRKVNLGATIYVLNRVLPLAMCLTLLENGIGVFSSSDIDKICGPLKATIILLTLFARSNIQLLIALRTCALWDSSKLIFVYLMSISVIGFILGCVSAVQSALLGLSQGGPLPLLGCKHSTPRFPFWVVSLPLLVFESSVLAFTCIKYIHIFRVDQHSPLVDIVVRNGIFWSLAITVCTLAGVFIELFAPPVMATFAITLNSLIPSLIASIILLDIQEVLSKSRNPHNGAGRSGVHSPKLNTVLSDIQFAIPSRMDEENEHSGSPIIELELRKSAWGGTSDVP